MTDDLDLDRHLRQESARFRAVLSDADPAARVPTCPDWSAEDLLFHLGEVQHFWGRIVAGRLAAVDDVADTERAPDHAALLQRFDEYAALLARALTSTPDGVEVWTWFTPDQSVRFVRRRQAHEALIHRVDAELTVGDRSPIDPALAADGVLEVLQCAFGAAPAWADLVWDGPAGVLRASDTGGEWWVQLGRWGGHSPDSGRDYSDEPVLRVRPGPGPAAFSVTATAADLDCWLWNRPPEAEVVVDGDSAALLALVADGVQ